MAVLSMDGHSSSFSGAALEALGLAAGHPDGVLVGESHELSTGKVNDRLAGSVTLPLLIRGIQGVVNEAMSLGLVSLHCLEGFEDAVRDPSLWLFSRLAGSLPLDIRLYVQYRDPSRLAPFRRFLRAPRIGGCFGWAMDGSVSSGTAAFDEAYASDPSNRGKLYFDSGKATAGLMSPWVQMQGMVEHPPAVPEHQRIRGAAHVHGECGMAERGREGARDAQPGEDGRFHRHGE